MASGVHDKLKSESDDHGKQQKLQTEARPKFIPGDKRKYDYRYYQHNENEACTAAGMKARAFCRVLRGKLHARFVAGDRLMLRAVILEGSPHVGYKSHKRDIKNENADLDYAFYNAAHHCTDIDHQA